jgi:FixJ family two-component response regulator
MNSPSEEVKAKSVVWIIDPQQWPRAYLRALLLEQGFDVIGFIELGEVLTALKNPHSLKPRVIVLELQGLSPSEDQRHTLSQITIPIVGIAGAVERNQEWIGKIKWAALIERPATIGQVADTIKKLTDDGLVKSPCLSS